MRAYCSSTTRAASASCRLNAFARSNRFSTLKDAIRIEPEPPSGYLERVSSFALSLSQVKVVRLQREHDALWRGLDLGTIFVMVATLDWLWGALAGGALTFAGTEVRDRLRHRRTIDGAAIDLARELLEQIPFIERELERAEDYRDWIPEMGVLVTAELRDRLGRAADHVQTRVRDPSLSTSIRVVHDEIRQARDAAREYDAAPRTDNAKHWEDSSDTDQYEAFQRVHAHIHAARKSTDKALARVAELERDRPRR